MAPEKIVTLKPLTETSAEVERLVMLKKEDMISFEQAVGNRTLFSASLVY